MDVRTPPPYLYKDSTAKPKSKPMRHAVRERMLRNLPTVQLQDAPLHAITEEQTIQIVMDELDAGRDGCIVTMNLDHMRRYGSDKGYRDLCRQATLHVADGMPLIWASRVQGTPLPERVTGSNLIWSLTKSAAENGRSIFLLGGEEGTADDAAQILKEKHPELEIAGTYFPPIGFEKNPQQMNNLVNAIVDASPDIVYVALGSPKQDKLIEHLRGKLPAVWWLGVGISFSFVSGDVSRAPGWMQRYGLEWLHRLFQEPRRLATRYLVHGLPFFTRLMTSAIMQRAGL